MLGASFDPPADNRRFAAAQDFGFPLLSDVDHVVGRAYEVVRSSDDPYAAYPLRISYLIDPRGVIRKVYAVTDVGCHADEVLADLKTLQEGGATRSVAAPPGPPTGADELQRRVEQVGSGGARAAVLGVSDGLVTNVSLILGLAGAGVGGANVRLAALASLVAGAFSMAAGEWISVRSQVELFQGVIGQIRGLVTRHPQVVLHELADRLEAAGLGRSTAQLASTELPLDEPRFLRFTARTVFGLDPDQVGSPWTAAVSSLLLFAFGALVPLVPWLFTSGGAAAWWSVGLTGLASVLVGVIVARSSERRPLWGALRQTGIVALAAAATYGIGTLFGTTVG